MKTFTLQSRYEQFFRIPVFYLRFKVLNLLALFNLSGKMSQIFGPRNKIWYTFRPMIHSLYWRYNKHGVTHSFVQKVLLQLKEIGHSLFYTFQL